MLTVRFPPPASLAPYLAFYSILDVEEGVAETYISPPLGYCSFIFCFKNKLTATLNGHPYAKSLFCAAGQVTSPVISAIRGREKILMVYIQPCGLYQLFGIDMLALTNTSLPLHELIGVIAAADLVDRLKKTTDNTTLVQVMNAFFIAQLPVYEIAPKVQHAIDHIHQQKGLVSIKAMERICFITPRSLERYFNMYIGVSPKVYARIFRFKCLLKYLHDNPGITWNHLCEQNGYYDQSHLTRYFSRYMNMKPIDLVKADMEFISYLLKS